MFAPLSTIKQWANRIGWDLVISTLLILCAFFYGLGAVGLLHNNEGLYGEIAREMAASGTYVIPLIKGVPYIEKPPLLYWCTAFFYHLFGVTAVTARLVPALSGVGTVLWCGFLVYRICGGRIAHPMMLILTSFVGFLIFSRMLFFDGLFTFCLTVTLGSFLLWRQGGRRFWLYNLYVFLALACLAKGLLGAVLCAGVVGPFWLGIYGQDRRRFWSFLNPVGIGLFLILFLPWHILATMADGGFAHFYFVGEHFLRFLGRREPKDYYTGGLFYYVHRLLLYVFPWPLILMIPLWARLKARWARGGRWNPQVLLMGRWMGRLKDFMGQGITHAPLPFFCGWWAFVFFVFFSLSRAKANYYIVTLMPPVAILLTLFLHHLWSDGALARVLRRWGFGLLVLCPVLVGGVSAAIPLIPTDLMPVKMRPLDLGICPLVIGVWIGLVAVFWIRDRLVGRLVSFLQGVTAGSVMMIVCAVTLLQKNEDSLSARPLMQALQDDPRYGLNVADHVMFYRDFEKMSSVPFYLPLERAKTVLLVDSASNDLLYGCRASGVQGGCLSASEMRAIPGSFLVFVYREQWDTFESAFPQYTRLMVRGPVAVYGAR